MCLPLDGCVCVCVCVCVFVITAGVCYSCWICVMTTECVLRLLGLCIAFRAFVTIAGCVVYFDGCVRCPCWVWYDC